jgi:hypothetical protein
MMDKRELLRRTGNLQQVASVRPVTFEEGRARGLSGYHVRNGPLAFDVLADKCLDLGDFSYKGVNFSFLSKPGLNGRNPYDTHGAEALRSIMGGMLFTCGYETICAPSTIDGRDFPMHGRMRTTPAEHRAADAFWQDGDYVLAVSGEMREAELFGENMLLRRSIETRLGEKRVVIRDEVENLAFRPDPLMLLYHFNVGHPLLSEAARVVLPVIETIPRDEVAKPGLSSWSAVEAPQDNLPEKVFIHRLASDAAGRSFAALVNPELGLGVRLDFDTRVLPYFMQWKSMASGDYVVGLEPANSSVYGKPYHHAAGDTHMLEGGATEVFELVITVLDGQAELDAVEVEAKRLVESR